MAIKTCLFDAYGTIFDVTAAARRAAAEPGLEDLSTYWSAIAGQWRRKQLEYSWQRTIRNAPCDFWEVTRDALDWVLEAEGLQDAQLRERLLALYWQLEAFDEAVPTLHRLRTMNVECAIVSNGSQKMLENAVQAAGLTSAINLIVSAESVGAFKPSPRVYDAACAQLKRTPDEIALVTANGWEATAAACYGFTTIWVQRTDLPLDNLPGEPDHMLRKLGRLPELEIF